MSKWINVGENLLRNAESGQYYVRVKVGGNQVWKSLKTDNVAAARLRKDGAIAKIKARLSGNLLAVDNLTLGKCVQAYLQGKRDEGLKPSSQLYCERSVAMIRENFPGFDARLAETFTPFDCKKVMDKLRAKYSARRFNGALWSLRGILEVAVKSKVIKENPADEVDPLPILQTKLELPAEERIELVMDCLRRGKHLGGSNSKRARPATFDAFLFLTLMLESSQRPGALWLLRPEHINLKRGTVAWLPFKHSKTTDVLPMTRKMKAIFRLLLRRHPGGNAPLVPIRFPRRALITACNYVGISPALTPHKFRHICSTRMAESNVPYALAAQWRRDTDGGATFMKVYVHPRHESMQQVVKALEKMESDRVDLPRAEKKTVGRG